MFFFQEHSRLVYVQDRVVEQKVADLKRHTGILHFLLRPCHQPVSVESFDGVCMFSSKSKSLTKENAQSRLCDKLPQIFFHIVLYCSHRGLIEVSRISQFFPVKSIPNLIHSKEGFFYPWPILRTLQSRADMSFEDCRVVSRFSFVRLESFQHLRTVYYCSAMRVNMYFSVLQLL